MKRRMPTSEDKHVVKKRRTAPTNTSLLPPCKVCLEPAAGFHYGANTCEACKGFFRRSLLRQKPYNCLGNGNCNIRAGKRQICPKCRHAKCLAVGMSKEAIKTGRYTHAKRTQDIIEYHQMMGKSLDSSHLISLSTSTANRSSSSSSSSSSPPPRPASPDIGTSSLLCASSPESGPSSQDTGSDNSATAVLDRPFELSSAVSPDAIPTNLLDSFGRADEAHSPSSASSTVPAACSPSVSGQSSSVIQVKKEPSPSSCAESSGDLLDEGMCEKIVRHLLQTHEALGIMPYDKLTTEELLEKQKACYEMCKLKSEMFGCGGLSDEEYRDIYHKTGLDVDNRQGLMGNLVPMLEENIEKYISFAKQIPGFANLSVQDQVNLIKNNRCEFRMMCTYIWYNYEMKVITFESGFTKCIHELAKLLGMEHSKQRFECVNVIRKMRLTREELIVLQCLMVVTVGAEDVQEPEKVSSIQWQMAQCLLWLLKQHQHDANRMFARIMTGLCYIRELSVGFYQWLRSNPVDCFTHLKHNTLLAEWFSNS